MNKIILGIIVVALLIGGIILLTNRDNRNNNVPQPGGNTTATATPNAVGTTGTTTSSTGNTSNVKEFVVVGSNFSFNPPSIRVNEGDTVRIVFRNQNGIHDFVLDEFNVATKQIRGGQEETVEFVASRTGTFEYYCSVGNHRAQGMRGTLIVE